MAPLGLVSQFTNLTNEAYQIHLNAAATYYQLAQEPTNMLKKEGWKAIRKRADQVSHRNLQLMQRILNLRSKLSHNMAISQKYQ